MNLLRLALLTCLCAALPAPAHAQWWLPGARTNEPPVPPAPVPGAPQAAPAAPGAPITLPGGAAPGTAPQAAPAAPPQARPTPVRTASEDEVVGRDLRRNGAAGRLRLERGPRGLTARLTLGGTRVSRPGEACEVKIGDDAPLALAAQGRPEGSLRYAVEAPACPLAFDVLEGAVLVPASAAACVIEASDCRAEVRGLWGPEPNALLPQVRAIELARGDADKAVRDNYRALSQRAAPAQVRTVVTEQAAFSAERDMTCRDYAREAAHGFCHARFTSARAVSLANRLGLVNVNPPAARRPPNPNPPATSATPRAQQAPTQPF